MNQPSRADRFVLPDGERKLAFERDTKVENAGTFVLQREDHTMGNLLRMCVSLTRVDCVVSSTSSVGLRRVSARGVCAFVLTVVTARRRAQGAAQEPRRGVRWVQEPSPDGPQNRAQGAHEWEYDARTSVTRCCDKLTRRGERFESAIRG